MAGMSLSCGFRLVHLQGLGPWSYPVNGLATEVPIGPIVDAAGDREVQRFSRLVFPETREVRIGRRRELFVLEAQIGA